MSEAERLTLRDCYEGDRVVIKKVRSGELSKRLREMGFNPNTEIEIIKYAPLKNPIEVVIKGYHVSLRLEEAEWIEVERLGSNEASS